MTIKEKIDKVKCFLLDLDGTVYLEGELIGDMKNTLKKIRESGRKIIYLTNNSSKSISLYEERLKAIGIWDENDTMYSSSVATSDYLLKNHNGQSVYVMGTKSLIEEFKNNGINVVDGKADVFVLGYDTEVTYEKLCTSALCLRSGAKYISTHPDITCPSKTIPLPDAGSFIKLFETSTGRLPEVICGKPEKNMGELIQKRFGFKNDEIIMVGDRLYTDIKFGINCGFNTLVVLSGESTIEDYKNSGLNATLVLNSLNDIVEYL